MVGLNFLAHLGKCTYFTSENASSCTYFGIFWRIYYEDDGGRTTAIANVRLQFACSPPVTELIGIGRNVVTPT